MAQYKYIFNPLAKAGFSLVPTNTALSFKPAVSTSSSLPSSGNNIGDARITEDTGHLWVWDGTQWNDEGNIIVLDWNTINGRPSSSPSAIDAAVALAGTSVQNVFGTAGQISSTGGTSPTISLISTAVTPGSYTLTSLTVDTYGRITSASSHTLTSGDITTALTYTPSKQAPSPTAGDIATVDVSGNVTDSGKVFDTDATMAANSDTHISTQKAIVSYVTTNFVASSSVTDSGVSISTDGTFSADSDTLVPTQKAAKTYADTKVSSVSGTSGRISSTGGTTPVLDLVTTAVSPASYTYASFTVDAYGRLTAASSNTPVTSFNTRTGAVTLTSSDVTTALGYTPSQQASSPTAGDIATVDASGNVTDSGKIFDTDGTLSANSDNHIATQKAILTYLSTFLAANQALVYKGALDLSSNPNYPAATNGWVYTVSVAGKIGGASGVPLTQGDLILCLTTNSGGDQATVGSDFDTIQMALNGIVIGPSSSVSGDFATFNGTSGAVIQDSGLSFSTDGTLASNSDLLVPSQKAVKIYADTKVSSVSGTSGRISSKGGTTPTLDLVTTAVTPGSYSYTSLTVDSYGRLTAASSNTPVTSFNTRTGAVTLTSSDVTTALGYTPVSNTTTVNGHALSSNVTVTSSDVGLGNVTNDAQIKASDFPGSSTDGDIALFNGTSGKSLKDSGKVLPSGTVVGTTDTQTLTNKRITRRVNTVASSATPSINSDTTDLFTITALATAITNMSTNLTGTPNNGDVLEIRILDNGTPQSITWGSSFASTGGTTLPTTTVASTTLRVLLEWNSASSLWECIGTT